MHIGDNFVHTCILRQEFSAQEKILFPGRRNVRDVRPHRLHCQSNSCRLFGAQYLMPPRASQYLMLPSS
jgi:hypothetical protein